MANPDRQSGSARWKKAQRVLRSPCPSLAMFDLIYGTAILQIRHCAHGGTEKKEEIAAGQSLVPSTMPPRPL
jgi:hypothetical protein